MREVVGAGGGANTDIDPVVGGITVHSRNKKDSVARGRDQEKDKYSKRPKLVERPDHKVQPILGF